MLIKIDDSIVSYLEEIRSSLRFDSPDIIAINNLAIAQKEGYHVIVSSFSVLKYLMNMDSLESTSKSIFSYLLSKFAFLGSYEEYCSDFILVTNNRNMLHKASNNGKIVFEVPLSHFTKLEKLFPTSLISENLTDCEFYYKIAKKYITENRSRLNVRLKLSFYGGGGDTTVDIYKYTLVNDKISLAIGDTDKSFPNDNYGETFRKLKDAYEAHKESAITDLVGLDIREKENLVPPSFYLMCSNSSCKGILKSLFVIEQLSNHQDKLKYLDIKDGMKAKKIKNNNDIKNYYLELFHDVRELTACSVEEIYTKEDNEYLFEGIGGKLSEFEIDILGNGLEESLEKKRKLRQSPELTKVIGIIEKNITIKDNLFDAIPPYLKNEWDLLCKKIISWGYSSPHSSAVS